VITLSLLGLGWNFGLISWIALIVDSTVTSTWAKTQGTVDVLIALSGAAGGALSGIIVAGSLSNIIICWRDFILITTSSGDRVS
jgi:hypothetical protein